ncbi:MAG: Ppx/GppA family phosphatase [Clostridia bacterium]|nr:Ppx/GppA family phosphatase [Clostridia bacterium]
MKYGIIDVGSNSVRLLIAEDGKTIKKIIKTTLLAKGIKDGLLDRQSSLRTLNAIKEFVAEAKTANTDEIYAFATAAVRGAENGSEFAETVKVECGVPLEILSGEQEAETGYAGALKGRDGAVLDIGGGSTEIGVVVGGKCVYAKSLPIGAVVLTEKFGQDSEKILAFVRETVKEYGTVPKSDFYCIGGTVTSLAAISLKLGIYDAEKVDGYKLTIKEIVRLEREISALSVQSRKTIPSLQPERADIIHAGACILRAVSEYVGAEYFTVSESDNLEGYLSYKTEKK